MEGQGGKIVMYLDSNFDPTGFERTSRDIEEAEPVTGWRGLDDVLAEVEASDSLRRMRRSRCRSQSAGGSRSITVANAMRLFHRVLYVATGSGIGPTLGHLLMDSQGAKLVWVTRNPRETFGDPVVDEITTAQPDGVIWNTSTQGKPDVFEVSYQAYVDSGADAVIIVSNRSVTAEVVRGFERRGVPAFGPIWDS